MSRLRLVCRSRSGLRLYGSMQHPRDIWRRRLCVVAMLCAPVLSGCASLGGKPDVAPVSVLPQPSHDRTWQPNLAVLPRAEFDGDEVTLHNIRQTEYNSETDYVVKHRDKTFRLEDVVSVDLLVSPFAAAPSLAHTMLSFGFRDGDFIIVSAEARLERGERYHPLDGALDRFELMYVIGDERDLILLRTKYRKADVYLYPLNLTEKEAQVAFRDALERANQLYRRPEFYNTLTSNCTTNIVRHIQKAVGTGFAYDPRLVLTGLTDRVAYDFGLIDGTVSYELTRKKARITELANQYADDEQFSLRIRRRLPPRRLTRYDVPALRR